MISQNQKIKRSDISINTCKSKATITQIIDRLMADNLVDKQSDPKERRSGRLQLTDKGRKLFATLMDLYLQEEKKYCRGYRRISMINSCVMYSLQLGKIGIVDFFDLVVAFEIISLQTIYSCKIGCRNTLFGSQKMSLKRI